MFKKSIESPEEYWGENANNVEWIKKPTKILDRESKPMPIWFPDGEINICYNALDKHIKNGDGHLIAFHYDSVYLNIQRSYTYQ